MRKHLNRITAFLLFTCMLAAFAPAFMPANALVLDENGVSGTVPLLVIMANFDPDGDGVDDFVVDGKSPNSNVNDPWFGEQWCMSSPKDQHDSFFDLSEGAISVAAYYREMTLGKFDFVPVSDTSGENDGIVEVTMNFAHPAALTSLFWNTEKFKEEVGTFANSSAANAAAAGYAIKNIIRAADEYVDFSLYDSDKNGVVTPEECCIVIMNAGYTGGQLGTLKTTRHPFNVVATSQSHEVVTKDGITLRASGGGNVSNVGEYLCVGIKMAPAIMAHELCHNLGAEDLYDRNVGMGGSAVPGWPQPYYYSLMHNSGCYLPQSSSTRYTIAYLDPYHRMLFHWYDSLTEVSKSGSFTLYSTLSGKYNIIKVLTPDPKEYFLVEVRIPEGFEKGISKSDGGVLVWRIDEDILDQYFESGCACTSYGTEATKHNPGIVPLANNITNDGHTYSSANIDKPFYYQSGRYSVFNSNEFCSPLGFSPSLNSFPDGVDPKTYNVKITVLSKPGSEMQIQIDMPALPVYMTDDAEEAVTSDSVTLKQNIAALNGNTVSECGFILSKDDGALLTDEGITKYPATLSDDGTSFTGTIPGLASNTFHMLRSYVITSDGAVSYAETIAVRTAKEVETTTEPPATTAEPTTEPEPTTAEPEPTTEPEATTAEPVVTTAEPVVTTAEPVTTTAEPAATTAEPAATTEPDATTAEPGAEQDGGGTVWIIIAIVAVVIIGGAAFIIIKKKKK